MLTKVTRLPLIVSLLLALMATVAARAAGAQQANASLVSRAVAFVRTLAQGEFQTAEADFTEQMKQGLPPQRLAAVWQQVLSQAGPFQDTGNSTTAVQAGYTIVVVRADFKSRALGIEVAFDPERKIAGVHFVAPP